MTTEMNKYEYIWLDGYQPEPSLRSKIKTTEDETPPDWAFDGSSTQQAEGGTSDCLLLPVQKYNGPLFADYLVMCQVETGEHEVHSSNTRVAAEKVVTDEWWFGFEQEYFFTDTKGNPLGWQDGTPRPQGDYYCGVGSMNVQGREISEAHLEVCLEAGIELSGTNAEVALGQWEYQCFGKGIKAGDDLWVSRYLLHKVAEEFGVCVNIHPKPKTGDWNGSGMHTNFSNEEMRTNGSENLMNSICEKLGAAHLEGIQEYGSDNDKRLTGLHETQKITEFSYAKFDRGASIRIPIFTIEHDWNGYLEDRRPASNADPYRIIAHIVGTLT
ncbi:MAG: glutamine synthetase beta-grasp domain-containing protein [SAR86 cluster bacterium]|nr:glutamine synthetase beta-grasp domain-containing protein [SAR86 cluster bacterium]